MEEPAAQSARTPLGGFSSPTLRKGSGMAHYSCVYLLLPVALQRKREGTRDLEGLGQANRRHYATCLAVPAIPDTIIVG
jgi:hypothetical protein